MRLTKIQDFMQKNHIAYEYTELNDCGSIDFVHRGLTYHIWEYPEPERGAESNVRICGRSEDYDGDYEAAIIEVLKDFR